MGGVSGDRLKALTVIHNFQLRRSNGATAVERLLKSDFHAIFKWMIE